MLALAHAERGHPRVTYLRQAIEDADFPPEQTDLVVSTLALHYVADYAGLVRCIPRWLSPGARAEHWFVEGRAQVPPNAVDLDQRSARRRLDAGANR
jgi:hypothetical protein